MVVDGVIDGRWREYGGFYGDRLGDLLEARAWLLNVIDGIMVAANEDADGDATPVLHVTDRVKSPDSMSRKLREMGIRDDDVPAMLEATHDAVGVRIVCSFLSDVDAVVSIARSVLGDAIVEERDYIRHPKPNGYRSHHLIVRAPVGILVEIQVRTMAMDTWAALEHQINYKKGVDDPDGSIHRALRACAAEITRADMTMQALKDSIEARKTHE